MCAGKNLWAILLTRQMCDVSGFHQSFGSLKDILIAQVATAVTLKNGKTVILIINKALYFSAESDHSLINPNQIRAFSIDVSDNPYDKGCNFSISCNNCFIPFSTEGSMVYFDSFVPYDAMLKMLRHVELTSNKEWDLTNVDMWRYLP